jgi:nitrite reductase/ring-hydroxylating ferredoxin subunit
VTFGALQGEGGLIYVVAIALGLVIVLGLHITAARREVAHDSESRTPKSQALVTSSPTDDEFVDACAVADIPENRARIICLSGERVAIFKYEGKISTVSNVCQHQNGPLGEGKIVFCCITCPWHGYQYQPDTDRRPSSKKSRNSTFA